MYVTVPKLFPPMNFVTSFVRSFFLYFWPTNYRMKVPLGNCIITHTHTHTRTANTRSKLFQMMIICLTAAKPTDNEPNRTEPNRNTLNLHSYLLQSGKECRRRKNINIKFCRIAGPKQTVPAIQIFLYFYLAKVFLIIRPDLPNSQMYIFIVPV